MTAEYCALAESWQDNGRHLSGNLTHIQRFITENRHKR